MDNGKNKNHIISKFLSTQFIEQNPFPMWVSDQEGTIIKTNKALRDLLQVKEEDVVGKYNVLEDPQIIKNNLRDQFMEVFTKGNTVNFALEWSKNDFPGAVLGDQFKIFIEGTLFPIIANGKVTNSVIIYRDVTEDRKRQEQLSYLSFHDSLTGLYNRRYFDEEIKRIDVPRNLPISIIMGDINGLKLTNDAFGHSFGDQLIISMANAIKTSCRADDIIARLGGDEFVILLPKTTLSKTREISRRINENCSKINMNNIRFSMSLGYDCKTVPEEGIYGVFKKAEDDMYLKKLSETGVIKENAINQIIDQLFKKCRRERIHASQVSNLCEVFGRVLSLSDKEISILSSAGFHHNIGKIILDEDLLNKTDEVTDNEYFEIKRHSEVGYRILSAASKMNDVAEIVLHHHERVDGKGYPNQLKGREIPLYSRILTIVDAYDAMTNKVTYKKTLSKEIAKKELLDNKGTQFDADLVEIFINQVLDI
ncbi:MAG: diguanylate cyclase [Clostridia bacterium]|nr:diguanylate cyclase [Clostridia bacterium]